MHHEHLQEMETLHHLWYMSNMCDNLLVVKISSSLEKENSFILQYSLRIAIRVDSEPLPNRCKQTDSRWFRVQLVIYDSD